MSRFNSRGLNELGLKVTAIFLDLEKRLLFECESSVLIRIFVFLVRRHPLVAVVIITTVKEEVRRGSKRAGKLQR